MMERKRLVLKRRSPIVLQMTIRKIKTTRSQTRKTAQVMNSTKRRILTSMTNIVMMRMNRSHLKSTIIRRNLTHLKLKMINLAKKLILKGRRHLQRCLIGIWLKRRKANLRKKKHVLEDTPRKTIELKMMKRIIQVGVFIKVRSIIRRVRMMTMTMMKKEHLHVVKTSSKRAISMKSNCIKYVGSTRGIIISIMKIEITLSNHLVLFELKRFLFELIDIYILNDALYICYDIYY